MLYMAIAAATMCGIVPNLIFYIVDKFIMIEPCTK